MDIDIKKITLEKRTHWESNIESDKFPFSVKLCYKDNSSFNKYPTVRFFEKELDNQDGFYVECIDWNGNPSDDGNPSTSMDRKLYKLNCDPHWRNNPTRYKPYELSKPGTFSYAVKVQDLVELSVQPITPSQEVEETEDIIFEKEDAPMSAKTMRDEYCMLNNVPMSNKKWLNDLITFNNGRNQKD
jgi:hypothetical protein